ncbi:MAG TPA: DUF951 domain-containing protein [Thermomicrobiaceae bacterium]|nr:DUF951 domain-containing protein [Thermomicrobiaceae bacterium]
MAPLELYLDDVVRLRKPHPCGSTDWTVVRLGADIGLRCHGCGHRVLLPRRTLEKRLKSFVSRGAGYAAAQAEAAAAGPLSADERPEP